MFVKKRQDTREDQYVFSTFFTCKTWLTTLRNQSVKSRFENKIQKYLHFGTFLYSKNIVFINQVYQFMYTLRLNTRQESINYHSFIQVFHTVFTVEWLLIVVHIFSSWYLLQMTPNLTEVTMFSQHSMRVLLSGRAGNQQEIFS